ncbi:MAG TPA: thermonuclease family protein [Gemmatimonadales bacterium]|nr:thermonuclease family protein [Gemmatimonadales bacterium]
MPVDSAPAAPRRATTNCVVSRISDGDTLRCQGGARVRLIGIDAPEREQTPFSEVALSGLSSLVAIGDTIQLEPDVDPRDQYDRVLAYAWRNGRMINWRMVREGWAVPLTVSPNVQYVDYFRRARDSARGEGKGLWKVDGFRCEPAAWRAKRC